MDKMLQADRVRRIKHMYYEEKMTQKQIAEIEHISRSYVRKLLTYNLDKAG